MHLSNLPPDIIRMILARADFKKLHKLRLISPLWNLLARDYFTRNRYQLLPIKSVYWWAHSESGCRIDLILSIQNHDVFKFEKWRTCLTYNWRDTDHKEICYWGEQVCFEKSQASTMFFPLLSFFLLTMFLIFYDRPVLATVIICILSAFFVLFDDANPAILLARMFKKCSHIEKLDLDTRRVDRKLLSTWSWTLGEIPIQRLVIDGLYFADGDNVSALILEMIRKHGIDELVINVETCDVPLLRELLIEVMLHVNDVRVYERNPWNVYGSKERRGTFCGERLEFWQNFAAELNAIGEFSARGLTQQYTKKKYNFNRRLLHLFRNEN